MHLHGRSIIAGKIASRGTDSFSIIAAGSGQELPPPFYKATETEIDQTLAAAAGAFEAYRLLAPERIAAFLERIAEEIVGLGDELFRRANAETALPQPRLAGERARTVNQLKMFAELVREGSWLEARIDRAIPSRQPIPKPDLRRLLIPIGPVVVFSASNFPLAFSVAGGDTASALAAGNPVVVKAHPGHPGTSELVARALQIAAEALELPAGVFSLVQGRGHEIGQRLVRHPATRAVGFTGSQRAGRALFDAAAARPDPIPVYAEMGSTNPVFILPGALQRDIGTLAQNLIQSVTLGVGQFCTNPGLVFGLRGSALDALAETAGKLAVNSAPGTMLYPALCDRFRESVADAEKISNVRLLGKSSAEPAAGQAPAVVLGTDAATFLGHELLREEMFGPSTLLVSCGSPEELERLARNLPGQLTATIHGTEEDLARHHILVRILEQKVGRLIFNAFPTGVEVCPSMHHGGPYPATTDAHFTSVGTAAIKRFARPLCFQNFPDATLPVELQNRNGRGIWRLVDGQLTTEGW
ncbi:MAG TPA: aldehyde dehydrogenase (NADP(+)) [Candidatus Binatia bacterium]|jgi:alpha-ketoglutaric semialdehyde dehydrogenase|nr:aldehyde dehydrogenase (NADP(+)) [Candidatus Binatia bacterium]